MRWVLRQKEEGENYSTEKQKRHLMTFREKAVFGTSIESQEKIIG